MAYLRDRSWLISFSTSTYDLPSTISRKFVYADDLALLHSSGNWKNLEETLIQDMTTLLAYLQNWRLKLCHTKTVTTAFLLNNQEAKRELKVYNNNRLLPFCQSPTYLGGKTGQTTHVPSPFSGIAQKTIFARHTTEATCKLRMLCWCQNKHCAQLPYLYSA